MKILLLFILFLSAFSKNKIYFYKKCDSSYTSLTKALESIGVYPCLKYVLQIAKLNSIDYPDTIDNNYNFGDPILDEYLLNLLKNVELISYIDNFISIGQIKENFNNYVEFSETKNALIIMSEYFIEKTDIKSPFMTALLALINYSNNFGIIYIIQEK